MEWKNKLQELDHFPGEEGSDKSKLWDELHSRLETEPAKIKAIWFWAAACILLAIIIPLLINSTKEVPSFVNIPAPHKTNKVTMPVLPDIVKDPVDVLTPVKDEKKPVVITNAAPQKTDQLIVTAKNNIPDEVVVETGVEKIETNSNIMQPLTGTETVTETVIASAVPVNKKRKIVHINELETFPEPLYSSGKQVQKAFRIELGSSHHNQSTAAPQEYMSALPLKIPFKN